MAEQTIRCEPGLVQGAAREGMYEFPGKELRDGDLSYTPFITDDGRVGYAIRDRYRVPSEGREEFIYLNPSESEGRSPDVFVYQGGENEPDLDTPVHFYRTAEGWEPEGAVVGEAEATVVENADLYDERAASEARESAEVEKSEGH